MDHVNFDFSSAHEQHSKLILAGIIQLYIRGWMGLYIWGSLSRNLDLCGTVCKSASLCVGLYTSYRLMFEQSRFFLDMNTKEPQH